MKNLRQSIKMADISPTMRTRLAKSVELKIEKTIFKQQKSLNLKKKYTYV